MIGAPLHIFDKVKMDDIFGVVCFLYGEGFVLYFIYRHKLSRVFVSLHIVLFIFTLTMCLYIIYVFVNSGIFCYITPDGVEIRKN